VKIIGIAARTGAVTLLLLLGGCGGGNVTAPSNTPPSNTTDTTAPTVSIISPSVSGSYATANATVSLAGSASDNVGVTSVTWSNAQGGSGSATGTSSWSIANIALVLGSNAITVTAHDAAGNTRNAPLTVTYSLVDAIAPTVSITSPTSSGTYSTASASVALAGSASDNLGVTSVTWSNAQGGASGSATGTSSWSIPSIALALGANAITVTAHDAAGNTRNANLTVTYSPSGGTSLSGSVDSSLINRNGGNVNMVYVYTGTVTPDDIGGSGAQPVATALVTQDNNACTFGYQVAGLATNTYTVAFINQADNPGANDAITFIGTTQVTVGAGGGAVKNFLPTKTPLQVGPTRTLKLPSAAKAVAANGDVIEIDAGDFYADDNVVWTQNNLTLRGVGGRAHLRSTQLIGNGKGIWVTDGQNTTVENIEFSGAAVTDNNGAGIRAEGPGLTVCNGYFHDNENGILDGNGVVLVEYSEFGHNGNCINPSGCAHNMYFSTSVTRFTLRYSYSHHAHVGHTVKSRALENFILYNRIMDETDGDSSYKIDIPNAGRTFIIGNLIQRGLNSQNSNMVSYGEEGAVNPSHELYVVNNTFVNDDAGGAFLSISGGTTALIVNNIFTGSGTVPSTGGTITATNNLVSNTPGLVDRANFDYRLTAGASGAIDKGTNPGTDASGTVSLTPTSQYVHPISREDRPVNGTIDIGAYEF